MVSFNKLFVGFSDAEKWLNAKGEEGLLLESVSDGKYAFKQQEGKITYLIDHTDDSPYTQANEEYIKSREEEGFKLACICGRTLYFYTQKKCEDYSLRFKHMLTHIKLVMLSVFTVFALAFGIALYEIDKIKELQNMTFEGVTPKTVAIIFIIIAAVSLGVFVMYGMEFFALLKKKKELVKNEQQASD